LASAFFAQQIWPSVQLVQARVHSAAQLLPSQGMPLGQQAPGLGGHPGQLTPEQASGPLSIGAPSPSPSASSPPESTAPLSADPLIVASVVEPFTT